jgi:uncharacterized protein (DUF1778 family)
MAMSTSIAKEARLDFRLPEAMKTVIEQAAAALGQSVSDYAVSTLVQNSRAVIEQRNATELSNRDRDRLLAVLDDAGARPNKALRTAAARYKRKLGRDG